jgi:hypothetical protein
MATKLNKAYQQHSWRTNFFDDCFQKSFTSIVGDKFRLGF